MKEFKHTPGPWVARKAAHGPTDIFDSNDEDICTIYSSDVTRSADARLIAAAPELLDALREALDCIRVYAPDYMHGMPRKHYVSQARAAIAKATGASK